MILLALALAQDTGLTEPVEVAEPRPWVTPEDDAGRSGVLGPWPDGYTPSEGFQRGLDVIDPLSGRVVEAGDPYISGEVFGPELPPDFGQPEVPEEPLPELTEPVEPEEPVAPEAVAPTAPTVDAPEPEREVARQLPVTPEPSLRKALVAALLAVLMLLATRGIERGLLVRLPSRGLLPLLLRGTVVCLRIGTLSAVLITALMLLPQGLNPAPAYVFIGVALAVGWTSRDVLRDFVAGVVLVVEHRLVVDQRVELAEHKGVIRAIGLRHVDLLEDGGQLLTVPNRVFLEATLHTDPDRFVPVRVRIHVPLCHDASRVRHALEELALLSPYLAPDRAPEVHRDAGERDVWIVRARLVDPKHAPAFRGAMVELADEVFARGTPAP